MTGMSRRNFVSSTAAGILMTGMPAARAIAAAPLDTPWAGERIVDCHFHARPSVEGMLAHNNGAGVSHALVLATDDYANRFAEMNSQHPHRFAGWARGALIPAAPEGDAAVTQLLGQMHEAITKGAHGFAEVASPVDVDAPNMQRLYAMASELEVPIMMHFQMVGVPGLPVYGVRNFSRIETMLKKYPKTRFVCHAADFWGHIDANYTDGGMYLMGKVAPGGLADRLLADYENMHGDLSAPSGLIQLARDPDFTSAFLQRHRHKLLFGSDCGCTDGRGGVPAGTVLPPAIKQGDPHNTATNVKMPMPGVKGASSMQLAMAAQGGLAHKCISRELLNIAWTSTPRDVFRKLVWENGARVYNLKG